MQRTSFSIFNTLALALSLSTAAMADTIAGDPAHSSAEFSVTHLALSQVRGTIPILAWEAQTNTNLMPQRITAKLDARSLDTHDADRDKDLRSKDWFEVDTYPTMTFTSTQITPGADNTFTALGKLTLHGVSKEVKLDGKLLGKIVDGKGRTHVGYAASTSIDRRDFGLNWGKTTPGGQLIVSNDISITLQAEGLVGISTQALRSPHTSNAIACGYRPLPESSHNRPMSVCSLIHF